MPTIFGRRIRPLVAQRVAPSLVTTKEIAATLMDGEKRNHAIVLAKSVHYPSADLLIDPYNVRGVAW